MPASPGENELRISAASKLHTFRQLDNSDVWKFAIYLAFERRACCPLHAAAPLGPAAADVLAATDGGGALAAFLNSSKGAFERTRDEFFVCRGRLCSEWQQQMLFASDILR